MVSCCCCHWLPCSCAFRSLLPSVRMMPLRRFFSWIFQNRRPGPSSQRRRFPVASMRWEMLWSGGACAAAMRCEADWGMKMGSSMLCAVHSSMLPPDLPASAVATPRCGDMRRCRVLRGRDCAVLSRLPCVMGRPVSTIGLAIRLAARCDCRVTMKTLRALSYPVAGRSNGAHSPRAPPSVPAPPPGPVP